jgi:hypothetical protein
MQVSPDFLLYFQVGMAMHGPDLMALWFFFDLSGVARRLWHHCSRQTPPCGASLHGTTTAGQLASAGTPNAW